MKTNMILLAACLLTSAGPALADPIDELFTFPNSYYAANYCHLKGHDSEQDMKLNVDKILLDIGADKLAFLLHRAEEGRDIGVNEMVAGNPGGAPVQCGVIWIKYGPNGRGWLVDGGVNASEVEKLGLQDREKELRKAAPVVTPVVAAPVKKWPGQDLGYPKPEGWIDMFPAPVMPGERGNNCQLTLATSRPADWPGFLCRKSTNATAARPTYTPWAGPALA